MGSSMVSPVGLPGKGIKNEIREDNEEIAPIALRDTTLDAEKVDILEDMKNQMSKDDTTKVNKNKTQKQQSKKSNNMGKTKANVLDMEGSIDADVI
eukprot:173827-Hanusia_phi.AAC.1